MYSYLKWKILEKESNNLTLLIDWTGLWFQIFTPITVIELSNIWDTLELFTVYQVSENFRFIFWFESINDKNIFLELTKISWIWWKVWVAIMSLWSNAIINAVSNEDVWMFESVTWIWKKTAKKIITELSDNKKIEELSKLVNSDWNSKNNSSSSLNNKYHKDIENALVNLWYDKKLVLESISTLDKDIIWLDNQIVECIKLLSK